ESRLIRRQYSISHPILTETGELQGEQSSELEFYIVLVTGNEQKQQVVPTLTPRLFALEPGDRLYVGEKITGHYTLEGVQPTDTVLFFSTGTGEAPNNYLLWSLLRRSHTGRILSASCVRHSKDLGYWATHKKLMEMYENYQYVALTTREPAQPKKYLQELLTSGELEKLLGKTLDPTQTHVFLCGNPHMIGVPVIDRTTKAKTYPATTGMVELLEQRGFTADAKALKVRGQVHFEEYW
ncbi:MAG TPA: ferredoxin--NADP reductase, partial [Gemmatales bacterium]|nr:ferredoxin--NADP reductase [Gemmatales bacterium]